MGEKAATSEMINRLVSGLKHDWLASGKFYWKDNMLNYLSVLSAFAVFYDKEVAAADAVVISKRCIETRSISPQRLLKVYMDTMKRIWLPAGIYALLFNRAAATVFENIIWVYDREGVTEIPISNQELFVELQKGFAQEMGNADLIIHKGCNLGSCGHAYIRGQAWTRPSSGPGPGLNNFFSRFRAWVHRYFCMTPAHL
jgi:hypothetical protein